MTPKILFFSLLVFLAAGCTMIESPRATVVDGLITNPTLGFFGFSFEIPEGFELYDSAVLDGEEDNAVRQLAIRIYELNKSYHPSGTETFYESFLLLSENTAFLLITVENEDSVPLWADEELVADKRLMPLYNVRESSRMRLGEGRLEARIASGRAYERKGWYYSNPKSGRTPFSYEACKVEGVNRDRYILMGFSLPEHEHILSLQMPELMRGFRF
jgi:hypothetical protein